MPYIGQITGAAVIVNNGDNLQTAIDAAGDGTTFLLRAGSYGDIELVGRNNLYFLAEYANTVEISGVEMYAGEAARDYTDWYNAIRAEDAAALALANNRPSGILFRNITFNGGGRVMTVTDNTVYNNAATIRGYKNVIFEDCTFTGYNRPSPMVWTPAVVSGNGLVDNIWCRRCTFNSTGAQEGVFVDGLFGGGVIYCTMADVHAQRVQINTNKDYTYDLDTDTNFELQEMRNANYVAIVENTMSLTGDIPADMIIACGAHILIKANVVTGSQSSLRFVHARAWEMYNWCATDFANLELIIRDNQCGKMQRILYIQGDEDPIFDDIGEQHVGTVGQYQLIDNVVTSGVFVENATEVATITGPNVVSGNTVI